MKTKMLILLLFFSGIVQAQNWQEWTQQNKTQREYLLQQIAALQIYISYAKTGYEIARKGLKTINILKRDDFNLHRHFISSLKNVNPKIRNSAKVADIIAGQLRILKQTKATIKAVKENGQFTVEEIDYCETVFNNLLRECSKTIDELLQVNTSGELEMNDAERIKRIDVLYQDMQNKHAFSASFSEEMAILSLQRLSEKVEIDFSKKINLKQ